MSAKRSRRCCLSLSFQELQIIDAQLSQIGLVSDDVKRLMTIPGCDATVALSIVAAVGDFGRFASPGQLSRAEPEGSRVRWSARLTWPDHQAGSCPRAACSSKPRGVRPTFRGPLRAFFERVRSRRGMQIAIVATARKLTRLCWHLATKREDYAFARPSLTAQKLRRLELRAGAPGTVVEREPPARTR